MVYVTCLIADCPFPRHGLRWCDKHYRRWLRYGDPLYPSQRGRRRRSDRERFESFVDRSGGPDACHPWTGGTDKDGYGQFSIAGRTRHAHAVAWEFARGPVPAGKQLDHECHNRAVRDSTCTPGICAHRACCNERHLITRTPGEHSKASVRNYDPRGEARYWNVKLSDAQVAEIRALLADGTPGRELSHRYKVSESWISYIKHGARPSLQ